MREQQSAENERLARALAEADPDGYSWDENVGYWLQFAANLLDSIHFVPRVLPPEQADQ